jgi:hypothetical protein
MTDSEPENTLKPKNERADEIQKLTALWALSEATVGGILHALKIPFRGMMISSIAIVLISMIAHFAQRPFQIIRSTMSVVIVKAAISPYIPLAAYLAVFLQGIFGQIYFSGKRFRLLSSLLLAITVSLLNGFQKIIVLTIVYGHSLWQTIDDFIVFANREWFHFNISDSISLSYIILSGYIAIHLAMGIIAGALAYYIPIKVERKMKDPELIKEFKNRKLPVTIKAKKKRKWLKPFSFFVIVLAGVALLLSYMYPSSGVFDVSGIAIMSVRSFLILFLWFYVVSPMVKNYLLRIFDKHRQKDYARDIDAIFVVLPELKNTLSAAWAISAKRHNISRILYFGIISLTQILRKS